MTRLLAIGLLATVLARPGYAQRGVVLGAGVAGMTAIRNFGDRNLWDNGAPGVGGHLGIAMSDRIDARGEIAVFEGMVLGGVQGVLRLRPSSARVVPYLFGGPLVQLATWAGGDGPGTGAAAGLGLDVRPFPLPAGLFLELRAMHLFHQAYVADPPDFLLAGLGVRWSPP